MSFLLEQNLIENSFKHTRELVSAGKENISSQYRGQNWPDVPVPEYWRLDLPFNQIAYDYCSTGRYLFLNRVKKIPTNPSFSSVLGKATDSALLGILKSSITYFSETKVSENSIYSYLHEQKKSLLFEIDKELTKQDKYISINEFKTILSICDKIISYEISSIATRVRYHISKSQQISKDTLRQKVVPLVIEPQISAPDLGFSDLMTPDFFYPEEKAIGDFKSFKYDKNDKAYKIAIAGYALAYEYTENKDVDLGFVLHLDSLNKRHVPIFHLDVFVVNDNLRKLFIQKRNARLNMISAAIQGLLAHEPGLPKACPRSCPYITTCEPRNIDENK